MTVSKRMVANEAMHIAKRMVHAAIRKAGHKANAYKATDITSGAKVILRRHKGVWRRAKANLEWAEKQLA